MALAPAFEVVNNWVPASTSNDPDDVVIAVVDLLVLSKCWYESEVARHQVLSLLAISTTDNGAVAFRCVHNRV